METRMKLLRVALGLLVIVACGSGPDPVGDGTYSFFAGSGIEDASGTDVEISGDEMNIVADGTTTRATISAGDETYTLCPDDVEGQPELIDGDVQIGGVTFADPAVFGDCGVTAPPRITIVDLDSVDEEALPLFTVWAEFCSIADPDC